MDAGVDGAWRYLNRLWRLVGEIGEPEVPDGRALGADGVALKRLLHRTIAQVTGELERLHFNKAVALVRELSNAIEAFRADGAADRALAREAVEAVVVMLGPMVPHIAEELWQRLGHDALLADARWPRSDPAWLVEDRVTVAVQVNGKLRATISLPRGSDRATAEAAALAETNVRRGLEGRRLCRVIVVPDKIVNLVV